MPTPSPRLRVQSGTFGGRFLAKGLALSVRAARMLAPAAARPAVSPRNRRREAFVLSVGSFIGNSRRMALQTRSYHILIHECKSQSRLGPRNFHAAVGRNAHGLLSRHIALDQFPHRGPKRTLAHARPAGDRVILVRLDRLARFQMRHGGDALADRL